MTGHALNGPRVLKVFGPNEKECVGKFYEVREINSGELAALVPESWGVEFANLIAVSPGLLGTMQRISITANLAIAKATGEAS